jgi:hypothetical protein
MEHDRKRRSRRPALGPSCLLAIVLGLLPGQLRAQTNPVPLIDQPLQPDAVAPGSGGFTITVNGTGFVPGSTVNWDGSPRVTTFVSSSQLTATINAADVAAAQTASVTVTNPAPGGGTSNVIFFPVASAISSLLFNRTDYSVASDPAVLAAADFNEDGKLDLVVASGLANVVCVLLGNGDGTFQQPVEYAAGTGPSGLAIADFNGDGKLDLAVADSNCPQMPCSSGAVSVLLGNGDGTFGAPVSYTVGIGPGAIAVGDFSGAGRLDLAAVNSCGNDPDCGSSSPGTISVLLGNGDGSFEPHVDYTTGSGPYALAVGDFNADGKLDLAEGNYYDYTIGTLLGNGDGTFQQPIDSSLPFGYMPTGIVVAGSLGGYAPALATVTDGLSPQVWLGAGSSGFWAFGKSDPAGLMAAQALLTADLNGDGILDLATSGFGASGGEVSVLLGQAGGGFAPFAGYLAGNYAQALATADFNGDGRLDLASAGNADNTVSILLQTVEPLVTISPISLSFPVQTVGTTSGSDASFLTNSGNADLAISSVTASPNFLVRSKCGSSVAAGASCALVVEFRPMAAGTLTGTVAIADSASGSPQTISLTGSGSFFSLSPTSLNFGNVTRGHISSPQTVTLTNVAKSSRSVSVRLAGGNAGAFAQTNNCGTSIGTGASCAISVTFTPKFKGPASASLQVNGGGGGVLSVSLSGAGVP